MCLKVVVPIAFLFAACTAPGGPERYPGTEFPGSYAGGPGSGVGGAGGDVLIPQALCATAQSSEAMPARSSVSDPNGGTAVAPKYFTANLYGLFKAVCGGCHVESNRGNFSVSESTFARTVDESIYALIISDDPATFMPPASGGGVPFSQRSASDAVVQLQVLLKLWIEQGRPEDAFELPAEEGGPQAGYVVSPELASKLTNIGTCIPDKRMVATSTSSMDTLDKMFAEATTLPPTLGETDLDALDSETLANHGVVSYAPAYPLWTDNAGKMRYVRVPRGKSIVFDKAKQRFHIPDNTRFYKTFLKSVVDADGKPSYRKIETRLIVARQDVDMPDGTVEQKALYGTYIWNEAETQATLLTDPLRNGKPFADRLFSYVTDESKAQAIIDKNPRNLASALQSAGLTRHYAVPGARRCVQCHMGSPSHDFSLGFTPLQINRRPMGTGGVIEPAATADELNQLQRLIDYRVITGVASATDVLPLEMSQGERKPRNDQELTAQGYLLGNCAHCHNARGFPSVKQPALKDLLIFLPGTGPRDGVFQMSLELMSPTRKRGLNRDVPIPYITPSLYDVPRLGSVAKYFCPNLPEGTCSRSEPPSFVLAPWRSLIYRNVDTPYDYFDDFTPYPHMPLNSPGFDCRVTKIMGDWMVSIPATLKDPNKLEYALPSSDANGNPIYASNANTDPQPYRESKPGDADYATAEAGAEFRLGIYHSVGYRYGFCPTTYTQDIINPFTVQQVNQKLEVRPDLGVIYDAADLTKAVMPTLTPRRPHWVNFDDTEPPGDWFPRRPDWEDALVHPDIPTFVHEAVTNDNLSVDAAQDLTNVLEELQSVKLTGPIRDALTREVPFGLWDTSTPGCNFSGVKTVGSFQGANRPTWMDVAQPAPAASAPVYEQSYGSAVFNTVCFNCHGANADSKGLLADEIAIMTGGDARVANFRDGLFGPVAHPGANRDRVFGPGATAIGGGVTGDDVAARYIAWMALGGTTKHLPMEVLAQVSDAPVLGALRAHIALEGTPDMLRLGLDLCRQIVTSDPSETEIPVTDVAVLGRYNWSRFSGLIDRNGDAEMWLRLCSLGNRTVVRVPFVNNGWTATTALRDLSISGYNLYWGSGPAGEDYYGPNPVMDHHGNVTSGITADNYLPLCIQKPSDPTERQNADRVLAASLVNGKQIPYCPDGFASPGRRLVVSETHDPVDGRRWAARGAINAALAVFLYLDQIEREPSKRKPLYNQCDLLGRN